MQGRLRRRLSLTLNSIASHPGACQVRPAEHDQGMKLISESIRSGQPIPERNAMGKPSPDAPATFSDNLSPHIAWSDLPEGTRSLVLACVDADAPTKPDDVNQEGRVVPFDLPRADFVHWVLVDIDPAKGPLAEGEFSKSVTPKGKSGPESARTTRSGLNDYTSWFKGDANMEGEYFGYDGPFPPWNDSRVHHYRFTLYALDIERCPVEGTFNLEDVLEAVSGHVLAQDEIVGSYKIYPAAK